MALCAPNGARALPVGCVGSFKARKATRMVLYLGAAFIFGVVASIIAYDKGRNSLGWFMAGMFIGPFSLLVVLLPRAPRDGRFVRCGACSEVVQAAAATCRFCGTVNDSIAERAF